MEGGGAGCERTQMRTGTRILLDNETPQGVGSDAFQATETGIWRISMTTGTNAEVLGKALLDFENLEYETQEFIASFIE